MVKSPELACVPAVAAHSFAEIAFEGLPEAVLLVNTRRRERPVVFANAAARRLLAPLTAVEGLVGSSLYAWLGPDQALAIDARLAALSKLRAATSGAVAWRLAGGEQLLSTELLLLDSLPGQRLVLLRFSVTAAPTPRRAPIDTAAAQLLILDANLRITYAGPGTAAGAEAAPGLQGCSALGVLPTAAIELEVYRRVLDGATFRDTAVEFRDPPRVPRWFDVSLQPLMGTGGVAGIIALSTEVTERRRWDRARARAEGRLQALTAHAQDVIAVTAADGRILFVSGGVSNALGFSPAERHSKSVFDLLHPEDVPMVRERYRNLVAGACDAFTVQYRIRHRDGSYRWFESSCVSALANPLIGGIVVNSRDITARVQAEQQLSQREEVFRLAAEAVDGIIFEWDLIQGTVHYSQGLHDVLGIEDSPSFRDPDTWYHRIHPADGGPMRERVEAALRAARGWTMSYRFLDGYGRYRTLFERARIQRSATGVPLRAIGCAVDVTDVHRLHDLLEETQRAARTGGWEYFFQTGEMVWTDETFRRVGSDRAAFQPTLARTLALATPDSRRRLKRAFVAAVRNDTAVDVELEVDTPAGARVWVRLIGQVDRLGGRPLRAYGSLQDIDAQKRAQDALRNSTGWLKLSMSMARLRPWRWSRRDDLLEFTALEGREGRRALRLHGLQDVLVRVHPDDADAVRRAIERLVAGEAEVREEFRLRARNGGYRSYSTVARPFHDEAGHLQGFTGVTQDVTANRESEVRLRRSEELLRATTANAADLLVLVDADLRIRFINRPARGIAAADLIGADIGRLVPAPDRDGVLDRFRRLLRTGEAVTFEYETHGPDGQVGHFEIRAALVRDPGPQGGICISVRDRTERKRMEREILDAAAGERLRIGQDLHDGLGQELTGVALMLRGLALRLGRTEPATIAALEEVVGLVNQSIEGARSMARGLLPVSIHRGGLVTALTGLCQRSAKALQMEVTFRAGAAPVMRLDEAGTSHLYRIAQEALSNAARHGKARRVDIGLDVEGDRYTLQIADDGTGIGAVRPAGGGMGLRIMAYRADVIGATLDILPNTPCGTIVRVTGSQPPGPTRV
jgi:PAS domain S-box-containing protein